MVRFVIYAGIILIHLKLDDGASRSEHVGNVLMGWAYAFALIELVLLSARFFRAEIGGQTLSALVILPSPLLSVVAGKLAGCLLALLPALALLCIGADNDRRFTGQAAAFELARRAVAKEIKTCVIIPDYVGNDMVDLLGGALHTEHYG